MMRHHRGWCGVPGRVVELMGEVSSLLSLCLLSLFIVVVVVIFFPAFFLVTLHASEIVNHYFIFSFTDAKFRYATYGDHG